MQYCKDFANLLFWVIWANLAIPTNIDCINLKNSLMFMCMQKINFIHLLLLLLLLLRCFKDLTNLLFWVPWPCLAMTSKNDNTSFQKTLMFFFMQKMIFIPNLFLQILKRYCKLVIYGTLGITDHVHKK